MKLIAKKTNLIAKTMNLIAKTTNLIVKQRIRSKNPIYRYSKNLK